MRSALRSGDWHAVPAENRTLTIPRERFKSDAEHCVPLSDAALTIIAGLPRFAGEYIFTSTEGQQAVNNACRAKARLDHLMLRYLHALARLRGEDPKAVKLTPFKIHDLRRTVRTNLAALGLPELICEMCLGHGRKGIGRTYDQHRYLDQQRDALTRWAERLQSIVQPTAPVPSNVVKLPKKARAS